MKKEMLKKVIGTMMVGVMLTGMIAGCGKENTEDSAGKGSSSVHSESNKKGNAKQEESGEAWKKLDFTLGGAKLVIPCTYDEFKKSGYSLSEEDEKTVLERNTYYKDLKAMNDNGDEITITVSNPIETEEHTVAEGFVVGMDMDAFKDYNNIAIEQNLDFTLWGDYKFGDSVEKFKEKTGEDTKNFDKLDQCRVELEGINAGIEGTYGDDVSFKFLHDTGEFSGIRINRFGEY